GGTLTARVGEAGDESVTVLVDDALRQLAYADVAHAAVQVEFRHPPEAEARRLGGTPTTTEEDDTE
ncbi:MAG: ribosome maturation factor RimP, partial [Pseudonocardia sp.]|nr:ribosome maturation factor RimP [Pseudonocardia sp.]